jgi:hypothetical protein
MKTKPEFGKMAYPVEKAKIFSKKVLINSVGGALKDVEGTVARGPCQLTYRAQTKKGVAKSRDGKVHSKEVTVVTDPYWLIKLNCNGFYVHFAESELNFV